MIDLFAALFGLLKHLRTSRTAAKTLALAALHLDQIGFERVEQSPRSLVFSIGSTEVTRVVISNLNPLKMSTFDLEPTAFNQRIEKLGVVRYFICTTQGGIFVFERIEAMRTGGHHILNPVSVEDIDVRHCLHLKKELIARALGGISRAAFFCAEHSVSDPCFIEQIGKGQSYFFSAIVEAARTANPEQDFRIFACSRVFSHGTYVHFDGD